MSLVAFCMMGGGALGTTLGQRVIEGTSFVVFYGLWGALLLVLAGVAALAVVDTLAEPVARSAAASAVASPRAGGGTV